MGGGRTTTRAGDESLEISAATRGDDDWESALRWLTGHCRFVTTTLPRGELGVSFAAQLLAGIPDACRRRVPDLTGTGPEVFALAVDYGILRERPSPRVMRAVPRLIAPRSPLFEARGQRHWTLWIVHALDPAMLAKIQRRTPASQLEICAPPPRRSARSRSRDELVAEVQALSAALACERALASRLGPRADALARELADKSAALDRVLLDAAALAEGDAEARRARAAHAELAAEHRALLGEVAPLRERLAGAEGDRQRLGDALREAHEINRALAERLDELGFADDLVKIAGGLARSLLRKKKG